MTFYYCEKCGNLAVKAANGGCADLACCGETMKKLEANTTDAAQEKHVPVVERQGNKIHVEVGSTLHPMTEDHYITMIAAVQGDKLHIRKLNPTDQPKADFDIDDGSVTVYEFCNKHGLWKVEA